jgi:hypothetical protein
MRTSNRDYPRHHPPTRAPACLLIGLALSCGGERAADTAAYTAVDSAGVRIVTSNAPALGEAALHIEAEPVLRIGQEGEGVYQFGSIVDGVLLTDGHFAIADGLARELRVFDAGGRHVTSFGGDGEGPGEFRHIGPVFAYLGDSIGAFDGRLYRTTIFSRASGESRTIQNGIEGNFQVVGVLDNGAFVLYNPGSGHARPELEQGLHWDSTDVVVMDPAGSSRVVARLPSRQLAIGPAGSRESLIPLQYAVHAVAEDGFYWATSDRYEIRFHDGDGRLRRILRRPVQPRAVDEAMIAEYENGMLEMVRRWEGEAAVPRYRRSFQDGVYGEFVPLFAQSFVDADGRLWLSESAWPLMSAPPLRWSLFSAEGAWLGDVEAPAGVTIVDSRADVVLGIWRDELDVQHVQLHRLTGG